MDNIHHMDINVNKILGAIIQAYCVAGQTYDQFMSIIVTSYQPYHQQSITIMSGAAT